MSAQTTECMRIYRATNRDRYNAYMREWRAQHKEEINKRNREYNALNQEKIKPERAKYRIEHPEVMANWRATHKKEISEYGKNTRQKTYARLRERRLSDPLFKMTEVLRVRTAVCFRGIKVNKPANTKELLGADYKTIKAHIENQFKDGMTWENHGRDTWHIDHKIPMASAKDLNELVALCHYTNLQPLWAHDNLRKHSKINFNVETQ